MSPYLQADWSRLRHLPCRRFGRRQGLVRPRARDRAVF
jgi:hypothetical protein